MDTPRLASRALRALLLSLPFALALSAPSALPRSVAAIESAHRFGPGLRWSLVWGGSDQDRVHAVLRASNGDWILCGETRSTDWAVSATALQRQAAGGGDAFLARLAGDGQSLRWMTYLGGSAADCARALCLADDDNIWVCGSTSSSDFPTTTSAWQSQLRGASDAFLVGLSADGTRLLASTYCGASRDEVARGIAWVVDHPVIGGASDSLDLVTTNGVFQPSARGGSDGFLAEFSSDLRTLRAATYCGGSARDEVQALLFDGELLVAGATESMDFPTTPGAFQSTSRGPDLFLARFSAGLFAPRAVTYFGGSGSEYEIAISSDGRGSIALGTSTNSDDLPTPANAFATVRASSFATDAYLARLDADLTRVEAASYLGGTSVDALTAIAFGPSGEILAAGLTLSPNFPRTSGSAQPNHASLSPFARNDAWVARLDRSLQALTYASYLGGSAAELSARVHWDRDGDALIVGSTYSLDFPDLGTSIPNFLRGQEDLYCTLFDLLPSGIERIGSATAAARTTPLLWANEPPRSNTTSFRLGLRGAPEQAPSLFLFAPLAVTTPWDLLGVALWLNPAPPAFTHLFGADPSGAYELLLAAPAGLVGQQVFVQVVTVDPATLRFAGSPAYRIVIG